MAPLIAAVEEIALAAVSHIDHIRPFAYHLSGLRTPGPGAELTSRERFLYVSHSAELSTRHGVETVLGQLACTQGSRRTRRRARRAPLPLILKRRSCVAAIQVGSRDSCSIASPMSPAWP